MAKLIVLFFIVASGFGVQTAAQTMSTEMSSPLPEEKTTLRVGIPGPKKFVGTWQAEMGLEGSDQGKDEGFASHFGARTQMDFNLAPMFSIRATPAADFYSARLQQRNESDDYQSGISVDDSYLQFMPGEWGELRAGALSQRFLDQPLLVSRGRAFPGVMLALHGDWNRSKIDVIAQTVVPTSRSLNTERTDREPIPEFQTQSVHFAMPEGDTWNFSAWGGHYSWSGLPSKVAFASQIVGNQPSTPQPATAFFQYGFDGAFGGLRGCYCVSGGWSGEMALTSFKNFKAPTERSLAEMIELSPSLDRKFWNLKFTLAYFFNESDTTPAYYNPARYGNNNRVGESFEARFNFKRYQFSLVAQYVNAGTINSNLNQQRLTSMLLGVETEYVSF